MMIIMVMMMYDDAHDTDHDDYDDNDHAADDPADYGVCC